MLPNANYDDDDDDAGLFNCLGVDCKLTPMRRLMKKVAGSFCRARQNVEEIRRILGYRFYFMMVKYVQKLQSGISSWQARIT